MRKLLFIMISVTIMSCNQTPELISTNQARLDKYEKYGITTELEYKFLKIDYDRFLKDAFKLTAGDPDNIEFNNQVTDIRKRYDRLIALGY